MATVKILRDCVIKAAKGAVFEVSDEEAKRLIAYGNAETVTEKKPKKKAQKAE